MPNENAQNEKKPSPEKPREVAKQAAKGDGKTADKKKGWDVIDEHAWESFPASDPPASWAGRDIPPAEREAEQHDKEDKKD